MVAAGDAVAQQGAALGDGGEDGGGHEDAHFAQAVGEEESVLVPADDDRENGRLAGGADVKVVAVRFPREALDVPLKGGHHGRVLLQKLDGFQGSGGQGRAHADGEHEAGQGIAQVLDQVLFAGQVAAAGAQALGQGAHLDVDVVRQEAEVFVHAAAGFAQDAGGMGLVHHQEAAVLLFEAHIFGNRGDVPVHGIDALHHDQHLGVLVPVGFEQGFQGLGIVMREGQGLRVGQADALHDGVMVDGVVEDQVPLAAEIADDGHVGGMAADQHQGAFGVLPLGQGGLQLLVQGLFPGQQAAARGGGAIQVDGSLRGLHGLLPAGHAGIVVGAEVQDPLAVHQAGVRQGRIVGDEIGVVVPLVHQGLLPLGEGLVFRGVLKADDRRHLRGGLLFLRLGDFAAEQALDQAGGGVDGRALPVQVLGNDDAENLFRLDGQGNQAQAVPFEVFDEGGVRADAVRRDLEDLGVELPHLPGDLPDGHGLGRFHPFGHRRGRPFDRAGGDGAVRQAFFEGGALDLHAGRKRQGGRAHHHPVHLLHGGQSFVQEVHILPDFLVGQAVRFLLQVQDNGDIFIGLLWIVRHRQADHGILVRLAGRDKEGLQLVRVDVFAGLVDDQVLRAADDVQPPVLPDAHQVAGFKKAVFRADGRELHPVFQPSGVQGAAADQQLAHAVSVRLADAVLGAFKGLADRAGQADVPGHPALHRGHAGFRHAKAADGVIAQGVEQLQVVPGRKGPADDHAAQLRPKQALQHRLKQPGLRQSKAPLGILFLLRRGAGQGAGQLGALLGAGA